MIAMLDHDDKWHDKTVASFKATRLPLATSAAVLAELFHVLDPRHHRAAWQLLRAGPVTTLPLTDDDLPEIELLMAKYHDRPMDFADATLVRLARREGLRTIFTVDDDFLVYRIDGRRRFSVVPQT